MLTIIFYANGYEIYGHIHPVHCGEVSAMAYFANGLILNSDKSARCFSGGNKGYTGVIFDADNKKAKYFCDRFKQDIKIWANNCFEEGSYEIKGVFREITLKEIEQAAKDIGLDYEFEVISND